MNHLSPQKVGQQMAQHLWQGQWINHETLRTNLENLNSLTASALQIPLDLNILLDACDHLSRQLYEHGSLYEELTTLAGEAATVDEIAAFLKKERLQEKLQRELGTTDNALLQRLSYKIPVFEGWAPLGLLVHVAPSNAIGAGALSVVEGLLTGNLCLLKTSQSDSGFGLKLLKALGDQDESGLIHRYIIATRISSQDQGLLKVIFKNADGIAVWGSEEAVAGVRALAPHTTRIIEWGPKISFAYVASDSLDDEESMKRIAQECCLLEQQACASPQCIFVDTEDRKTLVQWTEKFFVHLQEASEEIPVTSPAMQEQAEISRVVALAQAEQSLGLGVVYQTSNARALLDFRSGLRASPLFRTVWVKPLLRHKIQETLRPLRSYLQTVGLACKTKSISELTAQLTRAGVLRVNRVGRMLDSYMGEPHDGVYALQRYSKRISLQWDHSIDGIARLGAPTLQKQKAPQHLPLLNKETFQNQKIDRMYAELFFKSGGSSGDPKISVFTYHDYHLQMKAAAQGLYAAGLNPANDRCMNLFYGGGLYGGFVSFFTILESLEATQFPMAAFTDLTFVAKTIVEHKVNVILGMPSYIIQLFSENSAVLKNYGGVEKIFFGGEHFNDAQRERLQAEFGVEVIRSAAYGSVDAGPLGYQCRFSEGNVHHLHASLQTLEILSLDQDGPAQPGDAGRMIFTSHHRTGQKLIRYEIGDLGRWVSGFCACGDPSPRFDLMGRQGDIFKAAGSFLNYQKFIKILADRAEYNDDIQIEIGYGGLRKDHEELTVYLSDQTPGLNEESARNTLLDHDKDLHELVRLEKLLLFNVKKIPPSRFDRTSGSGKLRHVIDLRQRRAM